MTDSPATKGKTTGDRIAHAAIARGFKTAKDLEVSVRLIPLVMLLAILGAPSFPKARGISVAFAEEDNGLYGVACHSRFREVEGHAQHLCGDLPDNTVLIYPGATEDRALLLNMLRHESHHLAMPVVPGDSPWVRFQEARAYRAGCSYSWVPMCREWLR